MYKQALLDEPERLVEAGVLREKEDIFFLRFQELHDVVRTKRLMTNSSVSARRRSGHIQR